MLKPQIVILVAIVAFALWIAFRKREGKPSNDDTNNNK
jgi:multisubunit Na+/H+ antiporter MnhC subunit